MPANLSTSARATLDLACRVGVLHKELQLRLAPGRPEARNLYVRRPIKDAFFSANRENVTASAEVQAFATSFLEGAEMTISAEKSGLIYAPDFKLTRGDGPDVYEVRFDFSSSHPIVRPDQLRIFGVFPCRDIFLALCYGWKGRNSDGKELEINVAKKRKECRDLIENGLRNVFEECGPPVSMQDVMSNCRILT